MKWFYPEAVIVWFVGFVFVHVCFVEVFGGFSVCFDFNYLVVTELQTAQVVF